MAKIPKLGRVIRREYPDGEYFASIEWIDEEGYRVSGIFRLCGWNQMPRAIGEAMQKRISNPPKVLYYGRSRDRAANP